MPSAERQANAMKQSFAEKLAVPAAEPRRRRKFSAEYKLRVVREAEQSKAGRRVGALLRAEGLGASHLAKWRKQLERGQLTWLGHEQPLAFAGRSRSRASLFEQQKKELAKWKRRAVLAERLVELQKASLLESFESGAKRDAAIDAARRSAAEIGVAAACEALGIPRASYYRALARKRKHAGAARQSSAK